VSPKVALNLLLSIAFGLFGGLSLAFLLEYLSDRLENVEDIEHGLQLPVLTSIPMLQKVQ
jgi:capsular polysaccharide biosynthesis protein